MSRLPAEPVLCDLADALGVTLRIKDGRVTGGTTRKVTFGWVRFEIPLKIVAATNTKDGFVLLLRSLGDLGVFAARTYLPFERVEVGLIDLGRIKAPSKLFERHSPRDLAEAYALVADVEVGWFRKVGRGPWQEVTESR